jgi:branched-chain amino acid transport system substrate-binding protein
MKFAAAALLLVSGLLLPAGCERDKPLLIGFSGCLTGKFSDLGVSGRDGAMLAAERINGTGGVNGRKIELLIRDDENDPVTALRADEELMDAGVEAIIGHMTSGVTMIAKVLADARKVPMISPTASTEELTGVKDYFFRVVPPNSAEIRPLVGYVATETSIRTVTAAADASNRAYTYPWTSGFADRLTARGGRLLNTVFFDSGKGRPDYSSLAEQLLEPGPDAVLLTAGSLDTAYLAQQIRKLDEEIPLIPCGWAMTEELLRKGGRAVEGMVFATPFYLQSRDPEYTAFRTSFLERYGREPDFAAINAYEALWALAQALEGDCKTDLKDCLLSTESYRGLQGRFTLDDYGDPQRDFVILRIENGSFRRVETP